MFQTFPPLELLCCLRSLDLRILRVFGRFIIITTVYNIFIITIMEPITTIDIIITLLIISESIKSGGEGDSPASKRRRLSVSGHEVNILLRHRMIKTTIIGINVMTMMMMVVENMIMMTRRFLNSWSNAPLLYLDLRLVLVKQLVLDNLQDLANRLPTTFLIIRLADVIMQPIRQVLPWWSQ